MPLRRRLSVASRRDLSFVGISSDWLFPPEAVRQFAETIRAAGVKADYREMISAHGHDAFLAEQAELVRLLQLTSLAHGRLTPVGATVAVQETILQVPVSNPLCAWFARHQGLISKWLGRFSISGTTLLVREGMAFYNPLKTA